MIYVFPYSEKRILDNVRSLCFITKKSHRKRECIRLIFPDELLKRGEISAL